MNVQEQEEMEYEFGRASEFQNAYALSSMERRYDDPRIGEELAKGKFVVVEQCEQYCPLTDASLLPYMHFISTHDTREDADRAAMNHWHQGDDRDIGVVPYRMPEIVITPSTDDLPF